MKKPESTPEPGQPGAGAPRKSQPVYATQAPSFGSGPLDDASRGTGGTDRGPTTSRETASAKQSGFGTMAAPAPVDMKMDMNAVTGTRQLPSFTALRNVTQTHRADHSQVSMLARIAREQKQPPAGQNRTEKVLPKSPLSSAAPQVYSRTMAEVPAVNRTNRGASGAGRSTWNLKIHKRDVAGHISGIVNELPTSSANTTGLQSALVIDDTVPEYEVLNQLGAGNMGIVYRARQTSLNRELAIKTLKPETTHAEHDQAMFVSEAVVTANLVHPNIVPIHDLGRTADGKLFYSMKQVSGVSWNDIIRGRPLEDNLDIFMKLCDAVAYAHSKGVINRDLKPENVIVGNYGEVVVLDWGLAVTTDRFEKRNSVVVEFRGSAGTPVYMPPELADEDVSVVGPHSDIYLLGAILFEILEGFPPHLLRKYWDLEDPDECLFWIVNAVRNNEIEENVVNHGELMRIARKAMATEPQERHGSVEELQDAIREYRITGRAEELLRSVDAVTATDYADYQGAVALYSEALRKWPRNQRALEGDRKARLAYAGLALKKGDIDLGLQVVANHQGGEFAAIQTRLKKTRLVRTIIRGTWGVMSVAVCGLLVTATLFWFQADEQRILAEAATVEKGNALADLESRNGTIKELEEKEAKLKVNAAELQASLVSAAADRDKALDDARKAQESERAAAERVIEAEKLSAMKVAMAEKEAERVKQMAEMNVAEIKLKEMEAIKNLVDAQEQTKVARTATHRSELESLDSKIDAYKELGDYKNLVEVASDAIRKAATNPLIDGEKVQAFQKMINDVNLMKGNSMIPLGLKPDVAAVSFDGRTIVVFTRGTDGGLTVLKRSATDSDSGAVSRLPLPTANPSGRFVAASHDGSLIALVGRNVRQLWKWNGTEYSEIPMNSAATAPTGALMTWKKCQFSRNGQHLYLFGADSSATVEIYGVTGDQASLLLNQKLAGLSREDFSITDVDVLPDESAIIVAMGLKSTRSYSLQWNGESVGIPDTGVTAPSLGDVQDQRFGANQFLIQQLQISPDGQSLSLVSKDTVLILPRIASAGAKDFPFQHPQHITDLNLFKCSLQIRSLAFSADSKRIATGLDNRYIQIWDLQDGKYSRCTAECLYVHPGLKASSLRGHDKRSIDLVAFQDGSADELISVSADSTVRTWNIRTFSHYVSQFDDLAKVIRAPAPSDEPESGSQTQVSPKARRFPAHFGDPILVSTHPDADASEPGTQIGANSAAASDIIPLPRQGRDVYSAKFSRDGSRVVVGSDDLAAHVFETADGKQTLKYSMAGRKDLFFEPFLNNFLEGHISELTSMRFLPPNGELLLTADFFGSISVWDATADEDGVGYERSRLLSEYSFSEFAVSDDGKLVLAGGASTDKDKGLSEADLNHVGMLWHTSDFMTSPTASAFRRLEGQHEQFAITAVAISPNAERVMTAGRRGRIVIWNVADGSVYADFRDAHNRDNISGAFFESEDQLVTVGYDGRVFRWSVEPGAMKAEEVSRGDGSKLPEYILRVRPTPDRKMFATSDVALRRTSAGTDEGILTITIWTADAVRPLLPAPIIIPATDKGKAFRHDVSWSSDGSQLMLVLDGTMSIYDTTDFHVINRLQVQATTQEVPLVLPGTTDGLLQKNIRAVRGAIAPSADGKAHRAATFDGRVSQLWDLSTGGHLAQFRSHARYNVVASFSANQKYVATGSESLRIFDADEASPEHGRTLYRVSVGSTQKSPLSAVSFVPVVNDDRLATVDIRGQMDIWRWRPDDAMVLTPVFSQAGGVAEQPEWAEEIRHGNTIAWSTDGKRIAALQNGILKVWSLDGDQVTEIDVQMPADMDCRFNELSFSARENLLTAGGVAYSQTDRELVSFGAVWQFRDDGTTAGYRIAATMPGQHTVDVLGKRKQVGITTVAFDDVRDEILTGGSDGTLMRWQAGSFSMDQPKVLNAINRKLLLDGSAPHRTAITSLDILADGRIVTADDQGNVYLWPAVASP